MITPDEVASSYKTKHGLTKHLHKKQEAVKAMVMDMAGDIAKNETINEQTETSAEEIFDMYKKWASVVWPGADDFTLYIVMIGGMSVDIANSKNG